MDSHSQSVDMNMDINGNPGLLDNFLVCVEHRVGHVITSVLKI